MSRLEESDAAAAAVAIAPRVTLEHLKAQVASVEYVLMGPEKLLTVCALSTHNGYTVVGTSACAHPANFNQDLGRQLAYEEAIGKLWPLEGYLLRDKLSKGIDPGS